jgi:uncharacterized coiled-coil DUF342 family protein
MASIKIILERMSKMRKTERNFTNKVLESKRGDVQAVKSKIKSSVMVAPDKKTLKKSVKSMFFMVQTRCEVETIKY